jgi:hypothetical protein
VLDWICTELPPCPDACATWIGPLGAKAVLCSTYLANWYKYSQTSTKREDMLDDHLEAIGLERKKT